MIKVLPVPRSYRKRHHYQLGENQSRETNRHDVNELVFEEDERTIHYHTA
jgi:hypothetical protein